MDEKLKSEIHACALERFPHEMVGCVVGGSFVELDNISSEPEKRYQLKSKDKVMLFELGDSLEALVHSHPNLDNSPSDMDIKSQKMCQFPFWIVGTDGERCTDILVVVDE